MKFRMAPLAMSALLLAQRPAFADGAQEEARAHFARGVELYRDGAFSAALIEFRRADATVPNVKIQYNIGQTCLALKDYACALSAFETYAADPDAEISPARRAQIDGEIRRVRSLVAYVKVSVDRPEAEILVDDAPVGQARVGGELRVSVGRRKISATLPARTPVSRVVDLAGGDHVEIALAFGEPTQAPTPVAPTSSGRADTPPASPEAKPEANPTPMWIGIGATALLTAGAVGAGVVTLSADSDLKSIVDRRTSPSELSDAQDRVSTLAVITDVLLGCAVAAGAVTVYFAITTSNKRPSGQSASVGVYSTPTSAGVRATF